MMNKNEANVVVKIGWHETVSALLDLVNYREAERFRMSDVDLLRGLAHTIEQRIKECPTHAYHSTGSR
jgi:hypothetical protein